eukprot:8450915-Alexandrium_andersonii.AAC.2
MDCELGQHLLARLVRHAHALRQLHLDPAHALRREQLHPGRLLELGVGAACVDDEPLLGPAVLLHEEEPDLAGRIAGPLQQAHRVQLPDQPLVGLLVELQQRVKVGGHQVAHLVTLQHALLVLVQVLHDRGRRHVVDQRAPLHRLRETHKVHLERGNPRRTGARQ